MPKSARPWVALVSIFLMSLLLSVPAAAKRQDLEVLSVYPSGRAKLVKQFTVTFSQPMVPVGEMEQAADSAPLVVEPPMPGSYRWLNSYTLAFIPNTPLEGSIRGTVTVKARTTRTLSGAFLREEVKREYWLPTASLVSPSGGEDLTELELRPDIRLVFDQPLDPASLRQRVKFTTRLGENIPADVIPDDEYNQDRLPGDDWAVTVRPTSDLPANDSGVLNINAGVRSLAGPMPSNTDYRLAYSTYGPLKITLVEGYRYEESEPFDPESGLSLTFTNTVDPREVIKALSVEPEYDMAGALEYYEEYDPSKTIWLPGPFKPETKYTITFKPGLMDKYKQPLSGQTRFEVFFGSCRPLLDLTGRQGVVETDWEPTYPYEVRNVKKVEVRGLYLKPDQAVPFMIRHKLYDYLPTSDDDFLRSVPRGPGPENDPGTGPAAQSRRFHARQAEGAF